MIFHPPPSSLWQTNCATKRRCLKTITNLLNTTLIKKLKDGACICCRGLAVSIFQRGLTKMVDSSSRLEILFHKFYKVVKCLRRCLLISQDEMSEDNRRIKTAETSDLKSTKQTC